ncbi:MAG: BON domain-containing protein [Planctomycetaceae bacterium]
MNARKTMPFDSEPRKSLPLPTRFDALCASLEAVELELHPAKTAANGPKSEALQAEYQRMFDALPHQGKGAVPLPPDSEPRQAMPPELPRGAQAPQGRPVGARILDELDAQSLLSTTRLRISVNEGIVTIAGEVPGDSERQQVLRVTRGVSGVVEVVDLMRVVRRRDTSAGTFRRRGRRSAGRSDGFSVLSWRVGAAAVLLIAVWASYSYATRDDARPWLFPVSGTASFKGKPAVGAMVVLHPDDSSLDIRPKGFVKADGSYVITTYLPGDGAPRGDYRLTIELRKPEKSKSGEYVPGPNVLPSVLARPETTKYRVSVGWGKSTLPPIEIAP